MIPRSTLHTESWAEHFSRSMVRFSLKILRCAMLLWADCLAHICASFLSIHTFDVFPFFQLSIAAYTASLATFRKWFMATVGHQGLNNLLAAYEDKSAEAVCTFGYSPGRGQEPILFQGRCPVCLARSIPNSIANVHTTKGKDSASSRAT